MENKVKIGPEVKAPGDRGASTLTPWQRMQEHMHHLDRSLASIDGWSDESNLARTFIIGQIEALKWACKGFDV